MPTASRRPKKSARCRCRRSATGVDGEFELWGRLPAGDSGAVPRRFLEVTPTSEIPYFTRAHPALHRGLPRPTPRGAADGRPGVRQGRARPDRARRRAGPPAGRPGVVGTQLAEPVPGPVFHRRAAPQNKTEPRPETPPFGGRSRASNWVSGHPLTGSFASISARRAPVSSAGPAGVDHWRSGRIRRAGSMMTGRSQNDV